MKTIPMLSSDLIEQLDKHEGPLRINYTMKHEEILWKACRRAFIDELKLRLEATDKKLHESDIILEA